MTLSPLFHYSPGPILSPQKGIPWADTMVLNPSFIDDPSSNRLHMLFRATGPGAHAQIPGKPSPYPIYLGYATSDDDGFTWQADFSKPCLAPALAQEEEEIFIVNREGQRVINYANGCIEDPRLFRLKGKTYLTVACRMFPPGAYWKNHDPMQCAPDWAKGTSHKLGRAARENLTVSVLFELDLKELSARNYSSAFHYVTHLTDPEREDNRDVMLFPSTFTIGGKEKFLCLHRPMHPAYFGAYEDLSPSIFLSAADRLEDLATDRAEHRLLAQSKFIWEGNRIGTSWPPIPLDKGEWLLPYHGKQDNKVGYTQSFLILKNGADGWPVVAHRCPERLMYAARSWELSGLFSTPCLFTCGGMVRGERLLMSYGAADTVAGMAWVNFAVLIEYIRSFDETGMRHRLRLV